jgi:ankyrin repeat protein
VDMLSLALRDEEEESITRVDVNAPVCFPNGMRLLHVAAFHRQPHVVEYLLTLGSRIDVNTIDDEFGYTALGLAVMSKSIACCLALLRAGADAMQPCRSGKTPMFFAIQRVSAIVKDFVTIGGVDVNAQTTSEPIDSLPLTLAVIHKQQHLIPVLLELGADVNQTEAVSSMTALYHAMLQSDYYAAKTLLANGALPNQPSLHGRTPMHAAIEIGNTALIRLLVEVYWLTCVN